MSLAYAGGVAGFNGAVGHVLLALAAWRRRIGPGRGAAKPHAPSW